MEAYDDHDNIRFDITFRDLYHLYILSFVTNITTIIATITNTSSFRL